MSHRTLFKPHVSIEAGSFGLRGLGSEATDAQRNVLNSVQDFVETLTGGKAQREAQDRAVELQKVNAGRQQTVELARSGGWTQAAPWLAVAGAITVVGLAAVILRK